MLNLKHKLLNVGNITKTYNFGMFSYIAIKVALGVSLQFFMNASTET